MLAPASAGGGPDEAGEDDGRGPMNSAIYYHPEGYDTSRPKLMGRHAAGEAFLRAFARHAEVETLYCYADTRAHFDSFRAFVAPFAGGRATKWIPRTRLAGLKEPGCLFLPGPNLGDFAWQRRQADQQGWSLAAVTHTTATHHVMDCLGDLMLAPVQPWDALICTSAAVKATVDRVLEDWGAYLAERCGAAPHSPVRLPVIPLGVDCEALGPAPESGGARAAFRWQYGIADDDVVVLFMGRLSFHAKANPLPMFMALEAAAADGASRLHLVLSGWFASAAVERAFREGARLLCPSVKLIHVEGREAEVRRHVWSAADVFTSLSDNVQETFGLTPLEAMAAGLPVVASDWDGYRDTVRHGIDGFLVPTHMPAAGAGQELALRYYLGSDSYDAYAGKSASCVAVDIGAAAEAYRRLAADRELRRRMGQAGQQRARELFDWPHIIRAYENLWFELAERRLVEKEVAPRRPRTPAHPLRADPFRVFADYASAGLGGDLRVGLAPGAKSPGFRRLKALRLNTFADGVIASDEDCERLIEHLVDHGPQTVLTLLQLFPRERRGALQRTLAWMAKAGLVALEARPTLT